MLNKITSGKIVILVLPYIINDLIITVITGKQIGWAEGSINQNRALACIILALFLSGIIYCGLKYKTYMKAEIFKILFFILILVATFIIHSIFYQDIFIIILVYIISAILILFVIKDLNIE